MAVLTLKVMDKDGKEICRDTGEKQVSLVYGAEYREGDRIVLETSEKIFMCGFSLTMRWELPCVM